MVSFIRLSLARQFLLLSLLILIGGMLIIGLWVTRQIELGVSDRTAAVTALYVDSLISPHLQSLAYELALAPNDLESLSRLLSETALGQRIVAFKVWARDGTVLFSTTSALIGRQFEVGPGLAKAFAGQVITGVSDLAEPENEFESQRWNHLIETYAPVREPATGRILAVSEFYQTPDELDQVISASRLRSWLIVGGATAAMYVLLAGLVGRASATILSQQGMLQQQVSQLRNLLAQNRQLHERVRRAAARTTASSERLLGRISADLHDGPAQDLGLALLRIEALAEACSRCPVPTAKGLTVAQDFSTVQSALSSSLEELRSIAAGLRLPTLEGMSLEQTIEHAVQAYQRKSGTRVSLESSDLLSGAPLPLKITLFRVIQEALTNGFRHAGGIAQRVRAGRAGEQILMEISDQGPGFTWPDPTHESRLGLAGMRERVELLGGSFEIKTAPGNGTVIQVALPLEIPELQDA